MSEGVEAAAAALWVFDAETLDEDEMTAGGEGRPGCTEGVEPLRPPRRNTRRRRMMELRGLTYDGEDTGTNAAMQQSCSLGGVSTVETAARQSNGASER